MVEVVRTNFAPIFSDFQIFLGYSGSIVAPPSDNFENCSRAGKGIYSANKRCKPNLNRPTNADAMSCGSNWTTHQSGRRPTSVIYKKIKKWKTSHFVLSRRRASNNFHQILHGDRGGPCHHFRSKTFLGPVHSFAARGRRKFGWNRPIEVNC